MVDEQTHGPRTGTNAWRPFSASALRETMARLASSQADLALYVHDGADERFVQFVGTSVRVFRAGERASANLESHLLDHRVVPVETLHSTLEDARKSGRDFREVLVARGAIAQSELADIVLAIVEDEVKSLVFWEGARYTTYAEAAPRGFDLGRSPPLVASFERARLCERVCEWSRRWDEMRDELRRDDAPLRLTPSGLDAVGDPFTQLHALCVAVRDADTLRGLARARRTTTVDACEQVLELVRAGLVTIGVPASVERESEMPRPRIERLRAALDDAIGKERVRAELVELLLEENEPAAAATVLVELAEELLCADRWQEAVEQLERALVLEPGDHLAYEKLIQTLFLHERRQDALEFTTAHACILLDADRVDDARRLASTLAERSPQDIAIEDVLAPAFRDCATRERISSRLLTLAREYRAIREEKKSVDALALLVVLDPDHDEARAMLGTLAPERLDEIGRRRRDRQHARVVQQRTSPEYRRRRKQTLVVAAACLVVVSAFAAALLVPKLVRRQAEAHATREADAIESIDLGGFSALPGARNAPRSDGDAAARHRGDRPAHGRDSWLEYLEYLDRPEPREPASAITAPDRWVAYTPGGQNGAGAAGNPVAPGATIRQQVDDRVVLVFGPSQDLIALDAPTERELYRVTGIAGGNWAIAPGAERICRWKSGNRFQIYWPRTRRSTWSDWLLPIDTEAVAIGTETIATRHGDRTSITRLDGTPVSGGVLPRWTDGFFSHGELVLRQPSRERAGEFRIWVIDTASVQHLWSFRASGAEFHWR